MASSVTNTTTELPAHTPAEMLNSNDNAVAENAKADGDDEDEDDGSESAESAKSSESSAETVVTASSSSSSVCIVKYLLNYFVAIKQ